jgi:hypothetical protein
VIGDTGCRIKVPASGAGDPIQDCASPTDWPWPRIASAAARTQPDLVIHLGDYHYREYCDNPVLCAPLRDKGVPIGYDWAGWNADFFVPARRCSRRHRGWSCAATTRTATAAAKAGCASSRRCLSGLRQPALQERQPFGAGQQSDRRRLPHRPRPAADAGRRRQRRRTRTIGRQRHAARRRRSSQRTLRADAAAGRRPAVLAADPPADLVRPARRRVTAQRAAGRPRRQAAGQRAVRLLRPPARFQTINFAPPPTRPTTRRAGRRR